MENRHMKIPRWILGAAAVAALAVTLPATLAAQVTTGSVSGVITGQGSQPVEGVQVQVLSSATGLTRGVATNASGRYLIAGLETGTYTVTARRIGFAPQSQTVRVALGQTSRVDFSLAEQATQLSGVTVTATAASDLISPTRTGVQTTISDTALQRLPSLNRNFTDFVALTPQVSTTLPNGGLSGGGVNNRFNQVTIDGTNETDLFGLGSTGQPGGQANGKSIGIESVKEYQVLLTPFDVRQGNFAGLLINAITKSGTNEFHGSIYGYRRNDNLTRTQSYLTDYSQTQYGFSLGGPIIKNKVLFFTNLEKQSYSSPMTGIYLGSPNYNLNAADVQSAIDAIAAYGVPTGSAGLVKVQNPLTNFFARVDFPALPLNSQLTLRYNYGSATNQAIARGSTGNFPTLALTSNQYQYASTKNAPAVELRSQFGHAFNELRASYTRIRDPRTATGEGSAPQITVDIPGAAIVAGTERYSQGNEVRQDIVELTDNLTIPLGAHTLILGTQNEFYKAYNLYAQSVNGVWGFDSVDSLKNGQPWQYIIGVPAPGTGNGAVHFRTGTLSGYVQDQWAITPNFNLMYGLRADVARFSDRPPTNPDVLTQFGRNTAEIPSGHIQWSPRVGFNWDVTGDQRNQLRGGIGAFTGHPAYVWLSNAFQNSGLTGVNLLTCQGTGRVPAFNAAAVTNPPTACANGTTASAGSEIDLLQSDLRMPQTLRGSLGFDHDLGHNLVATVEGLYTKALYSPFYYNLALTDPIGTDAHGRVLYGTKPNSPSLKVAGRSTVLDVANQNKDHFYNITGQLARRFADGWEASAAYTYSRGWDVQSFTSSTAYSQYRYGRVYAGNQMDQTATRSAFEQRHRIVAHGSYQFPTLTTVSLIYTGASGIPYTFVYNSDMNGDGLTANDPIYVPKDVNDPNEIQFASSFKGSDGVTYTAAEQAAKLDQFINSNDCLNSQRGQIMTRNSCTAPWTNTFNVSLRQSLRTLGSQNVSVQLDIFNFGNLLNNNWGRYTSTYGQVNLLGGGTGNSGLPSGTLVNSQGVFNFNPAVQVFNYDRLESNYQMQLSLRYSF
jgi:hypothetical protein